MPDPDRYAVQQAASLRDDWQFSRIFAHEKARPGFTPLLALRAELQLVIAQSSEPGITTMKFEWWRGEIERGFAGNAQHPLARALGAHLGEAGIAAEYAIELVDAAETESESSNGFSEQEFQLYLYRSGGVLAEMLAALSGLNDRKTLDAARHIGQVKRLNDMLLATGAMLRAQRWMFPANWLQDAALAPDDVLAGGSNVRALLDAMLAALDHARVATRTAMENVSLPPALMLQWSLAQRDHAQMRATPEIMLAPQPAKGAMLSRLWTAWRAARRAAENRSGNARG